jgi:predicted RNase H-like HicB family nuclease
MHNEFTAIVERDGKWYVACIPEIPGANGQGRTKEACLKSLAEAIDLILEDRREDALQARNFPCEGSFSPSQGCPVHGRKTRPL